MYLLPAMGIRTRLSEVSWRSLAYNLTYRIRIMEKHNLQAEAAAGQED